MRYLVIVKATPQSERGEFPPNAEQLFAEMGKFNDELIAAGLMLDGAGLKPSSEGRRVSFRGRGNTTVTEGPFAATSELVSGYWIWKCKDLDEALSWARRIPFEDGEVEVRPFHEPEDFEGVAPAEDIEKEKAWRAEQEKRAQESA